MQIFCIKSKMNFYKHSLYKKSRRRSSKSAPAASIYARKIYILLCFFMQKKLIIIHCMYKKENLCNSLLSLLLFVLCRNESNNCTMLKNQHFLFSCAQSMKPFLRAVCESVPTTCFSHFFNLLCSF